MTIHNRHFWLYAKYHYRWHDVIKDLQVIMGKRCALEPEQVRVTDIETLLLAIVSHLFTKRGNPVQSFTDFVFDCRENSIILTCLSFMANTEVKHIGYGIGEPDAQILPISNGGR